MITLTAIKKYAVALGASLLLAGLGQNNAHALALPDVPLSKFSSVEHNVLLTFDDSGSMAWAYLPDTVSGLSGNRRGCSSTINGVYYNPTSVYTPPVNADGTPRNAVATSFVAAYRDGYNIGSGTVNLATSYQPSWSSLLSYVACGTAGVPGAAFYYTYNAVCGNVNNDACYTLVRPIPAAEQQNFANWYSYYRTRNLMAKTAAGLAFQGFGTNVRIAGQHLNNATAGAGATIKFTNAPGVMERFCDDPTNSDALCIDGSTARTDFYTRLYNSPTGSPTPLIQAMQRAGQYFGITNNGANSPYRDVPGVAPTVANPNPELSCRKNFHIMMTDGFWNGALGLAGNYDGTNQTLGDGTAYTPKPPYNDSWSGTLADNSFYYWSQDLRPDLTNNVKPYEVDPTGTASQRYWNHVNDPATWQHMQSFTIGLGVPGTRNPANYFNLALPASAGDWDELLSGVLL
jgi:type IV pilus assembly protein PilY1